MGATVRAINPRGDTAGCFTVDTAGSYGLMHIYGEDNTAQPPLPGMRPGEVPRFEVNGLPAIMTPEESWQRNAQRPVDLVAESLTVQQIALDSGWNLISSLVNPLPASLPAALSSIAGKYDRLLGEYGVFAPTLDPAFNS